jgi:hypothetical protein
LEATPSDASPAPLGFGGATRGVERVPGAAALRRVPRVSRPRHPLSTPAPQAPAAHCLTPSRQSGSPHRRYRDGSGSALMCRGSGRGATSASRPQLPSLWRGQSSARAARRRNRRARYPQEADCGLRARRCALPLTIGKCSASCASVAANQQIQSLRLAVSRPNAATRSAPLSPPPRQAAPHFHQPRPY